jgi:hypothetical protein
MAADSAVTVKTKTGRRYVEPGGATKLQAVPSLNAGVSCWVAGAIGSQPTDQWLTDFIHANSTLPSIRAFAQYLATELQSVLGSGSGTQPRLGFHVAGYEEYGGRRVPSFYHVHDGPSTTLAGRGISIDPTVFNANHDMPPAEFQRLPRGIGWITRNGDYQFYAQLFMLLEKFFHEVAELGIIIPHSQELSDRAEYLVFQIRTVSKLYRMSNLVPGIGGGISYLTISPDGIHGQGVVYQ